MDQSIALRLEKSISPTAVIDELSRLASLERVGCDATSAVVEDLATVARALTSVTDAVYESLVKRSPEQVRRETAYILRGMVISATLEEALAEYGAHMACYWSAACTVAMEPRGDRVFVVMDTRVEPREKLFLHDLRHCSMMLSIVNWLCGETLPETIAHLPHAPIDLAKVQAIFPYGLSRDGAVTGVSFRRQDMRKPVVRTPGDIEAFIADLPRVAVLGAASAETYSRRVSAIVAQRLLVQRRIATVVEVCDHLGLSSATLHRRLSAERTSFRKLRDSSVNLAAKTLIEKTDAGIPTISDLLGYSEEGAFRRSFIRWNGCSPAAYRRRSQAAGG